jgi:ABC-type uncharacterized transport system permease subunit
MLIYFASFEIMINNMLTEKDLKLYPSVMLVIKMTIKLLQNFIRHRIE